MNPSSSPGSDLAGAYSYCERLARSHYENFPVASHLLPGALLRNEHQKFLCKNVFLKDADSNVYKIPLAHGEGRYYADEPTLRGLKANNQVLFTYCDEKGNETRESNPNGSVNNIAGICNFERNVIGMMPHPERACSTALGNTDGRKIFELLFPLVQQLA